MIPETRQPPPTDDIIMPNNNSSHFQIPSESELVLLSLDYLRDLRRTYNHQEDLLRAEGLDADWLTLAIYALNRSFEKKNNSLYLHNDAWKSDNDNDVNTVNNNNENDNKCCIERLPTLQKMTEEVVYAKNPNSSCFNTRMSDDDDLEAFAWYEYDDAHPSNQHRYYLLQGLGGGGAAAGAASSASASGGPLLLGEIAAAGLHHLQAKSRHEADREIKDSPLFEQFLEAVHQKGFFADDAENEAVYQSRFEKVVAKFRTKLASKADPMEMMSNPVFTLADAQYTRRMKNCLAARKSRVDEEAAAVAAVANSAKRLERNKKNKDHDIQEAERLKNVGNAHMQQKDYPSAAHAYTKALGISPDGPNSHVYFSNRAAAHLSMKRFTEAITDSERSLALKPDYGKAYARLGLAHFLLGDYRPAMEAYELALKYEPDNKSSISYLEKAKKRLARRHEDHQTIGSSFSVVSEWAIPTPQPQQQQQPKPPTDAEQREAEKAKVLGNQLMAQRQYQQAFEAYTTALQYCPHDTQSHVYYSNRAAALCYLERYQEAAEDSERSIQLQPDFGKAHARLGLSKFFMNDYAGAIQAYNAALQYDPNNAASQSYLAKAKLKWEQQKQKQQQQQQVNQQQKQVNQQQKPAEANFDIDARRLLNDPDMQAIARKAMSTTPNSKKMMEDPEMMRIARKAVNDPAMRAAVNAVAQF